MEYEAVIGLEIHAQLNTRTKMFCPCPVTFGQEPNSRVCPVCLGMPGSLPVPNRRAVEMGIRVALATHCRIAPRCCFARKNYFYPDLPKGYQISQYDEPLATDGWLEVNGRRIGIIRMHLEEDAGKLLHGPEGSLVDFNRTGVPLLEIVTAPDLRTPQEASDFLQELRAVLQYLEVCDGDMEKGNLRCDANVSVRPRGSTQLGTKVELKNLNSFRFLRQALQYEIDRQVEALRSGEPLAQETRLWDPARGMSLPMRTKEEAHDYRYFPDPDLVPLRLEASLVERLRASLPELPQQRRERFMTQYGLPAYDARVLTSSKALADWFERCVASYPKAKAVSNWVMSEVLRLVDPEGVEGLRVRPEQLAALLRLVDRGTISNKIAKEVLEEMARTGQDPDRIVQQRGLSQISDPDRLRAIAEAVLRDHPQQVEQYRAGKQKLLGFFVGQVMKRTGGRAHPQLTGQILRELLEG